MNNDGDIPKGSRFPWVVVLIVLLAVCAGLWYLARPSKVYVFRFRLRPGQRYTQSLTGSRTIRYSREKPRRNGLTIRREFRVYDETGGYRLRGTPLDVNATSAGRRDALHTAIESAPFDYRVTRRGSLRGVSVTKLGLDGISRQLTSCHNTKPGSAAALLEHYRKHIVLNATDTWEHRVNSIAGRKARITDGWTVTEATNVDGERIGVRVNMVFRGLEKRNGMTCAVIDYRIASDNESVRKDFESAINSPLDPSRFRYTVTRFAIWGGGRMVVEIDGMRTVSDSSSMDLDYVAHWSFGLQGTHRAYVTTRCTYEYPAQRRSSPASGR